MSRASPRLTSFRGGNRCGPASARKSSLVTTRAKAFRDLVSLALPVLRSAVFGRCYAGEFSPYPLLLQAALQSFYSEGPAQRGGLFPLAVWSTFDRREIGALLICVAGLFVVSLPYLFNTGCSLLLFNYFALMLNQLDKVEDD